MNDRLKESKLLWGLLAILMLVTSVVPFAQRVPPTSSGISEEPAEGLGLQDSFIPSYIIHSPITITSNADFIAQGFLGSGIESDPYRIEGYNITTTGTCISIQGTDAYFVIRDCLLTGGTSDDGITLDGVSHGEIRNSTISEKQMGVSLYFSSDNTVVNNTISGNNYGVRFFGASDNTVENNTLFGNDIDGMRLLSSSDNTLSSNIFVNNGISISGDRVEYWRHAINTDNLLEGKPLGYFWNLTSGNIDGTQYGQVILANCTGVTVADSVFSNASVGIALGYSSYCSLKNNTISGIDDGVYLSSSSNNTIVNNTISGNGVGVRIHYSSDNNAVVNNTISGKHRGVYIFASSDNSVVNNVISGSSFGGMSIHFSSSNNTVVNNTISGNGIGVWLYESSNNTVVGNTISGNYADGVYLYSSSDNTLVNNTISGNSQSGVSIFSSSDNTLVNNTISGNNNTGVSIWTPSSDNLIYLNVIADNNNGNAYDDGTDNHWNITGRGNYWSDHTGTGVYHIPGSAGSIDYYPFIYPPETTTPTIDQPADMDYVEGITGNTITWTPSDEHPSHYVVYRNGTVVVLANWDESSITVEVDGLSVGVYNYTIVVYDTSGNWASDTVLIIVLSQTTTTSTTITNGDVTSLVILFLGVGGIGVVIVVLILMRHRRGSMTGL